MNLNLHLQVIVEKSLACSRISLIDLAKKLVFDEHFTEETELENYEVSINGFPLKVLKIIVEILNMDTQQIAAAAPLN